MILSSGRFRWVVTTLALLPLMAMHARAQTPDRDQREPTWTLSSGTRITLFPSDDVYSVYVADPHRPTNAMLFRFQSRKGIPDTTTRRTALAAGGRFGMIRIERANASERSWQISLDAGLDALFDSDHSDEALGWDGNYGLTITTASNGRWSCKVAVLHTSAHLGDEYAERIQENRVDYTREELAVGVGWRPSRGWRVYGEVGRAYRMKSSEQAPWRLQQGVEYETPRALFGGRFAWYGAADFDAMQERRWRIDRAIETGIVTRSSGHTYRILLQYYTGRPTVAEFFRYSETSITLGLRIEL